MSNYQFIATWVETEQQHDYYSKDCGTYPKDVKKFAVVKDMQELEPYIGKRNVQFYTAEQLTVTRKVTVEMIMDQ